MKTKAMRCPECEEITTFAQHYGVRHSAPVVLSKGKIIIDHESETEFVPDLDETTCTCKKCGNEVYIPDIEFVELESENTSPIEVHTPASEAKEEGASEELRIELSRLFVDTRDAATEKATSHRRIVKRIAAQLGLPDGKEAA